VRSLTPSVIFFAASLGSLTMHRHTQKRSVETKIIAIVIKIPNIMSIFAVQSSSWSLHKYQKQKKKKRAC